MCETYEDCPCGCECTCDETETPFTEKMFTAAMALAIVTALIRPGNRTAEIINAVAVTGTKGLRDMFPDPDA